MDENKTKPTKVSVTRFISSVDNETRREHAKILLKLFSNVTGWKAQMLGPAIVGFGLYHYKYELGRTGSACVLRPPPTKE
jgi:hypothetical protein